MPLCMPSGDAALARNESLVLGGIPSCGTCLELPPRACWVTCRPVYPSPRSAMQLASSLNPAPAPPPCPRLSIPQPRVAHSNSRVLGSTRRRRKRSPSRRPTPPQPPTEPLRVSPNDPEQTTTAAAHSHTQVPRRAHYRPRRPSDRYEKAGADKRRRRSDDTMKCDARDWRKG